MKRWHKRTLKLALAAGGLLSLPWLAVQVGSHLYTLDAAKLTQQPSTLCYDRHGEIFYARTNEHGQWHLPVPLSEISPAVIEATLAVEDQRFREHGGVDWIAVVRAARDNGLAGRTVSGASTLTMQLVRLCDPQPRSLSYKFRQACLALALERSFSKEELLERYLNLAPYGGNLVGIEAAARAYFDKPASKLSRQEAALLAGLPQRPAALRPDRHPKAALQRMQHVWERLHEEGYVAEALPPAPELLLANIQPAAPGHCRLGLPQAEPLFAAQLQRATGQRGRLKSTLDLELQRRARELLLRQLASKPTGTQGAVVILENGESAVRALVGSTDFENPRDGLVNAALARRSSGSTLKPFIYLAALDQGLIVPQTRLLDTPLQYRDYRPGNYDGQYRNSCSASEALSLSLNTPAVRLSEQIGIGPLLEQLQQVGLRSLDRSAEDYGLSLALGGGEVSLLELTNAFAGLAREGRFLKTRWLTAEAADKTARQPWQPASTLLLREMLLARPLPTASSKGWCWKTGTSSGHRDAWCLAFSPEYTVGVWLGRKDGQSVSELNGLTDATPLAAELLTTLEASSWPPLQAPEQQGLEAVQLCLHSGLRARGDCRHSSRYWQSAHAPLAWCGQTHGGQSLAKANTSRNLRSPEAGIYYQLNEPVKLALDAGRQGRFSWFLNGELIARASGVVEHAFERGEHELSCIDAEGQLLETLAIVVR